MVLFDPVDGNLSGTTTSDQIGNFVSRSHDGKKEAFRFVIMSL